MDYHLICQVDQPLGVFDFVSVEFEMHMGDDPHTHQKSKNNPDIAQIKIPTVELSHL